MKYFLKNRTFWEVMVLLILSLIPLLWFSPGQILYGHDAGFHLAFPSRFSIITHLWDQRINFGIDQSLFTGFIVNHSYEVFMHMLFGFLIGQRVVLIFWFFMMGLGMYIFLRSIFPEKQFWILRLFSSVCYMYNFYILQAWFIAERAKFSLYAALPVGLLLIYRVLVVKKSILQNAVLFGLLYFFFNGGGAPPLYGATLVSFLIAFSFFTVYRIVLSGIQGLFLGIKAAASFGLSVVFFNAYWIIPQIFLYFQSYASTIGAEGGVEGILLWEKEIGKYSSFTNLFRLQGIPDWYNNAIHAYANAFLGNPILIIGSFIPVMLILCGLIRGIQEKNHERKVVLIMLFFLLGVGLLFTAGSHPPFGQAYLFLMRHVPGFAIFRSSFYKFAPSVWLPVIVLSGYFLNTFLFKLRSIYVRNAIGTLFILGVLFYHYPYFVTDFFQFSGTFTTKVTLPSYVSDMSSYIETKTEPDARMLLLPELDTGYIHRPVDTYTWNYFSLDVVPRNAGTKSFVANDSNTDKIVQLLYQSLYENNMERFFQLAGKMGITHILWRNDVLLTKKTLETTSIVKTKATLDGTSGIQKIFTSGEWTLYNITSPYSEPRITASSLAAAVERSSRNDAYLLSQQSMVLRTDGVENKAFKDLIDEQYEEAVCVMCQKGEYKKLTESITIPPVSYPLGSLLHKREQMKEESLIKASERDPKGRINIDLSIAQRRLAYLQKNPLPLYASEYRKFMTEAYDLLKNVGDDKKNEYMIRVLAYMEAQRREVERQKDHLDLSQEVYFLDTAIDELQKNVWMTEKQGEYRYGLYTSRDGEYNLRLFNDGFLPVITIDGVKKEPGDSLMLKQGFHRIALQSADIPQNDSFPVLYLITKNKEPVGTNPQITAKKISPTQYRVRVTNAVSPFFLELKERFDPRWKAYMGGSGVQFISPPIGEENHMEVNGFANAWYMEKTGDYDIVIFYLPEKLFYVGAAITILSFILGLSIFFFYPKKISV